jgi:hypothetical protein
MKTEHDLLNTLGAPVQVVKIDLIDSKQPLWFCKRLVDILGGSVNPSAVRPIDDDTEFRSKKDFAPLFGV